jgi:Putative  PD-(D/E)XK family member, (DUF4420)
MTRTRTIEDLWHSLKGAGTSVLHTRIDETHPLELYAEFEPPNRPGLVLFCPEKPPEVRSLRTLTIEEGYRPDHKWWLRLSLIEPELQPVFAALCRDIVAFTRSGVTETAAPGVLLGRLARWRALMEGEQSGMGPLAIRGLIGELLVLETDVLPILSELEAIRAWTGPLGSAQDFLLPGGCRLEVKSARPEALTVEINGLDQLDGSGDPLTLVVVRLLEAAKGAAGAENASRVIARLNDRLATNSAALSEFENRLAMAGWHQNPAHEDIIVRMVAIDRFQVDDDFPRLTRKMVPSGVHDAHYSIILPKSMIDQDRGKDVHL